MLWQRTTIARPQFVEPSPTVTRIRFSVHIGRALSSTK
jgi:hypothetical protein